jgi:hypothetical protein
MSYNSSEDTSSFIKRLNKEWREYTKQVEEIIGTGQKNITVVIRRRKGCSIPLCDIFEIELEKLSKIIDEIDKK